MNEIFISPSRYVQGQNLLLNSAEEISKVSENKRTLIMSDETVWGIIGNDFASYLEKEGFDVTKVVFGGEASMDEINRISKIVSDNKCDSVIGLGGGKTLDSAKGIAQQNKIPVVIAPTVASADAPTSGLSVIYTEEGQFDQYLFYNNNPELVLADTTVIANAPVRMLKSGIADALATNIEGMAVSQANGKTMAGGLSTFAGRAIAEECERVIFKYGLEAIEANKAKQPTKALESIVEANTLLSGLGFENAGLSAAHAIHNGFTAISGDIHHLTHGEKVSFGTICELVMENAPHERLDRYIKFYLELGLPTTMEDVHLDKVSDEDLMKIGKLATAEGETMEQMPFTVTPEDVVIAIKGADIYVKGYKERHNIK